MSEKKKFNETDFGKFVAKAGKSVPGILDVAVTALTGNIGGAVEKARDILTSPENRENPEAQRLLHELEMKRMDFEREMFSLEVADKNSARNREIEIAKTRKTDWMMIATGLSLIIAFIGCVLTIIFWQVPETNRDWFIHLLGIIEGAFVSGMVSYYYGTSKSSADKTKMLKG